MPQPVGVRAPQAVLQLLVARLQPRLEAVAADLERAHRLLERLLERAADGHRLAHRLHLRPEGVARLRELLEREARDLRDDVVDGGLEAGRRLAGDVVAQLVERVAHGQLGGDLRDREPGRLGRQRRAARHARVHLDDHQPAGLRMDRELDVRAARVDADRADDRHRGVAHELVFLVGQRLRRRDRDGVAGVHAHRVEVLDRAHDDDVVLRVAHHLELELLPARDRLLDQDLADRRGGQAPGHVGAELLLGLREAAAGAAERARRPQDGGQADLGPHALAPPRACARCRCAAGRGRCRGWSP